MSHRARLERNRPKYLLASESPARSSEKRTQCIAVGARHCQYQLIGDISPRCVSAGFLIECYIFLQTKSSVSPAPPGHRYLPRATYVGRASCAVTRDESRGSASEAVRVLAVREPLYYWAAAILSLAASIPCGQSAVWPRFICRENARLASRSCTRAGLRVRAERRKVLRYQTILFSFIVGWEIK